MCEGNTGQYFLPDSPGSKSTACIQGKQWNLGDPEDVDQNDKRKSTITW